MTQPSESRSRPPLVSTRRSTALLGLLLTFVAGAAVVGTPTPPDIDVPRLPQGVVLAASDENPQARPTTPRETRPERRRVTVTMGGDLLWHDTVWQSAATDHRRTGAGRGGLDFNPMFGGLRSLVRDADLAICHEEVPFAAPGAPYESYPVFAAPPQIARWIGDFGWDACVTASNHSLDQGFEGVRRTATLLEDAGVRHVGTFRSARERRQPVILETEGGVRVGLVAGTYGLNGFPLPEGREWSVSMWGAQNLLAQARAARRAGADIVMVAVHWGWEYTTLPNAEQVALARRLTRSPAVDLVFGEHAHVVQPITRVNGKWVVYGMGNMIAQQETSRPETYEGISVRFAFRERREGGFEVSRAVYVPTAWSTYSPARPIRITREVPGVALRRIRDAVHALGGTRGLVER
jgi:hypothetical protein